MAVLSDRDIERVIEEGRLKIHPFERSLLEPASYDLRVGRILASGGVLNPSEVSVFLKTGEWVEIETKETLELPNDLIATFGLRSSIARRGIIGFGGPQVDPGYRGKLYVGIFNPSSQGWRISAEEPFLTIQFFRLESSSDRPYEGKYQNLQSFPEEDVIRMSRMDTPTLADVVQSVSVLERTVSELKDGVRELRSEMRWSRWLLTLIFTALIAGWIMSFLIP